MDTLHSDRVTSFTGWLRIWVAKQNAGSPKIRTDGLQVAGIRGILLPPSLVVPEELVPAILHCILCCCYAYLLRTRTLYNHNRNWALFRGFRLLFSRKCWVQVLCLAGDRSYSKSQRGKYRPVRSFCRRGTLSF